jgi:hypothetical protein
MSRKISIAGIRVSMWHAEETAFSTRYHGSHKLFNIIGKNRKIKTEDLTMETLKLVKQENLIFGRPPQN